MAWLDWSRLEDCPPAVYYFFTFPSYLYCIYKFLLLNLQNSFEDRECMHYSLSSPFFLLVDTFLEFSQYFFEKRKMVASHFSKEFSANPRNVLTNRKSEISLS